jgi:thiol-disulfide isomerase/thioredoxin
VPRAAPDAATPDKPAGGWWTKDVPDNVLMVTNVQEMVDVLEQAAANDQLVVFECFAPWCGSCKALFHKMKKICKEHSDVRFVLLNFEENRKLAKGLGIKVLPFFHFYRGADGKVEELTASISKIDRIKDAITRHKSPRCYLPANGIRPYIREYPDVEPSAVKAEGQGSPEAAVL